MDDLYQQIIEMYKDTGSVKKTAEALGTYPIKVRKVLITENLWHSKTSDQVRALLAEGKSVSEIAAELVMSEKNVQSYLPYTRGQYGGEDRSNEAVRSEEYRERKQKAAKNQVTKTEARSKNEEDQLQEQRRLLEEMRAEKEKLLQEKKELWDIIEADMKRIPLALQLHLELDLGYFAEENKEVLRKYGRMKEGISRDFIVPGNMTLHALHYAIMKAFGWQNSHLHSYVPDKEEYQKMTDGGLVKEWTRQVGMYFRFPSDDYEDIYWDDDYEEGESIKSWLKSKYCGPYDYAGTGEHYIPAQIEVDRFRKEYPAIQKKTTDQRNWNVYFDGQCEEMIERHMIWSVLKTPADHIDWASWKREKEAQLKMCEIERKKAIREYKKLDLEMDQVAEKASAYFNVDVTNDEEFITHLKEMARLDQEMESLCFKNDPEPIPALSSLCYRYDYGDDWQIRITCTNAWYNRSTYARDEEGNLIYSRNGFVLDKQMFVDAYGQKADGDFLGKLKDIAEKEKPVCIAWDGTNLVDDVGGIGGFCDFLETINGSDAEEKKRYKTWAKSLGWTGRMPKPENML